jgi:predicted homoserine dehydrogenase-like protein
MPECLAGPGTSSLFKLFGASDSRASTSHQCVAQHRDGRIDNALKQRAAENNPIRVGVVGAGFMGRGMVDQMIRRMTGFDVVAIYNRTNATAQEAYAAAGVGDVQHVEDADRLDEVIASGGHATVSEPGIISAAEGVEAVMEITGELEFGATVAVDVIQSKKHLILVNAEVDATV